MTDLRDMSEEALEAELARLSGVEIMVVVHPAEVMSAFPRYRLVEAPSDHPFRISQADVRALHKMIVAQPEPRTKVAQDELNRRRSSAVKFISIRQKAREAQRAAAIPEADLRRVSGATPFVESGAWRGAGAIGELKGDEVPLTLPDGVQMSAELSEALAQEKLDRYLARGQQFISENQKDYDEWRRQMLTLPTKQGQRGAKALTARELNARRAAATPRPPIPAAEPTVAERNIEKIMRQW